MLQPRKPQLKLWHVGNDENRQHADDGVAETPAGNTPAWNLRGQGMDVDLTTRMPLHDFNSALFVRCTPGSHP